MPREKLVVVVPLYNEREILPELFARLRAVFDKLTDLDAQVIYVDDGSQDGSSDVMNQQHAQDDRFTIVQLSRNFGQQPAISAGLEYADGDAVILIDGDLQDPPEVILDLAAAWRAGGQVVRAERRSRAERGPRRWLLDGFHRLFGWLTDFPIPGGNGTFCLLDRRAVEELKKLPERHRFLPGLRAWIGFEQRAVPYDRQERAGGTPKQTWRRLHRYALDAIFSFSYKPLRLLLALGLTISFVGLCLATFFIARRILGIEEAQTGFTTLVTLILFLGGTQLVAIGVLGEYLGRIYDEAKHRPLFIVRSTQGLGKDKRN